MQAVEKKEIDCSSYIPQENLACTGISLPSSKIEQDLNLAAEVIGKDKQKLVDVNDFCENNAARKANDMLHLPDDDILVHFSLTAHSHLANASSLAAGATSLRAQSLKYCPETLCKSSSKAAYKVV
uniref:Uncharacterized protein n=1 Tax=Glossina morsitans morsitans TaxID=37546 RepID=A0A1B0FE88_GLOMM